MISRTGKPNTSPHKEKSMSKKRITKINLCRESVGRIKTTAQTFIYGIGRLPVQHFAGLADIHLQGAEQALSHCLFAQQSSSKLQKPCRNRDKTGRLAHRKSHTAQ